MSIKLTLRFPSTYNLGTAPFEMCVCAGVGNIVLLNLSKATTQPDSTGWANNFSDYYYFKVKAF